MVRIIITKLKEGSKLAHNGSNIGVFFSFYPACLELCNNTEKEKKRKNSKKQHVWNLENLRENDGIRI